MQYAPLRLFIRARPLSRLAALALMLAFGALLAAGCANTARQAGLPAVSPFDLQRYQGLWYEIARLDHRFERGLTNVSAQYTPQPDGSVRVVNRGFLAESGRWREAVGKGLFKGSPDVGSLKVSFFGPFYGDYDVVALDPDYRWALVLGGDTSYCWILARDKTLGAAERDAILARAKALGVDTSALIWVTHDGQDPAH